MFNRPMKTRAHKLLSILNKRGELSAEQQKMLVRMDLGYKGEMHFFKSLEDGLSAKPIKLYNLQMKINGSECQIDCLLIFQHEIIIFEVKNYQGDFIIQDDKWYTLAKNEIRNPFHQLQRSELLLQQFLTVHKSHLKVNSFLVFTNSAFFLYNAPVHAPIIFPNQLNRSIQKLQNISCSIREQHDTFANVLKAQHRRISAFESIPTFDYATLRKGITCNSCHDFMVAFRSNNMRCVKCDKVQDLSKAVIRTIREYHILLPDEKIKMKTIIEWTNYSVSPYKIRKIIRPFAQLIHKGKESYYVFHEDALKDTFE